MKEGNFEKTEYNWKIQVMRHMSTEVSDVIVPWEVCIKKEGPEGSPKPVPAPLCCVDVSLLLHQIWPTCQ